MGAPVPPDPTNPVEAYLIERVIEIQDQLNNLALTHTIRIDSLVRKVDPANQRSPRDQTEPFNSTTT